MNNKKLTQNSSFSRRYGKLGSHRKARFSAKSAFLYVYHSIGQWMYVFGAGIEIAMKRVFRAFGKGIKRTLCSMGRGIAAAAVAVWSLISGVARDIWAPIHKLFRSTKSLVEVVRSTGNRGPKYTLERVRLFFKYGWMWNKHLIHRMLNYLLPAVSLALCLLVVHSVASLNYALEVNYNGQTIGYVTDESVYNSARKIVQSRMITGVEQSWTGNADLHITVVERGDLTSQDVMAETLLSVSGEEIVEATGLYVGGTFYGATAAGDLLNAEVEQTIAPYESQAQELGEDAVVKYKRDVELVSGIFPAESVLSFDEMQALVHSSEPMDIYYEGSAGEKLSDIALINGITVERLQQLNPGVDTVLTADTRLLVAENEPLFNVRTVRQTVTTQVIDFETKVTRDERFENTFIFPVTDGQNGERTIVTELEYENGVIVSERIISDEVTIPAIDREIIMGGKPSSGGNGVGSGNLIWPTIPQGPGCGISRGWQSNHFGVDIWSAYGTPLYAADNGVVVLATSIPWDYGTYIIIDHQNGMLTVYGHNSVNLVSEGDVVSQGEVIALMGSTGNSTGNHVHFEVRLASQSGNMGRVDPNLYLHYWS